PQALKRVIARLGEAAFERAMAIVEANLPNTSLIEAITPFASPRVARTIARAIASAEMLEPVPDALKKERFEPSTAQAWLEINVRDAALGLVPIALDESSPDAPSARACLGYL